MTGQKLQYLQEAGYELKNLNFSCSCRQCDSFSCFATRNQRKRRACYCNNCKYSKTCLYVNTFIRDRNHLKNCKPSNISCDKINKLSSDDSVEGRYEEIVKELQNTGEVYKHVKDSHETLESSRDMNNDFDKRESDGNRVCPSVAYSPRNMLPAAANLSAQIMNISYKDLKEVKLVNQRESPAPDNNIISKLDILQRIKEAYKACSCNLCECITSTFANAQKEQCKCTPCGCDDCKPLSMKIQNKLYITQTSRVNCPCIMKNTLPNEMVVCDCKPCDCIKCSDSFTKSCQCKPCQCIECKSMFVHRHDTVIVAPIAMEHARRVCDCQPCECTNCGQDFAEMSTGINRHPNCHCENCANEACEPDGTNLCKCQRLSKIIKKPVERDTQEFDIRRASVPKKSLKIEGRSQQKAYRRNAIAMFACVSNISTKYSCRCETCECLVCKCKNDTSNSVKTLKYVNRLIDKVTTIPAINSKICACEVCYCCSTNKCRKERKLETLKKVTNCKCDVCECLKCEDIKKHNHFNEVAIKKISKDNCKFEKADHKNTPIICTDDIYHSTSFKCERYLRNAIISKENTACTITGVESLFSMVKKKSSPLAKGKQRGKLDFYLKSTENKSKDKIYVDLLNKDIDFKRGQSALQQARAVSFELLKILHKYEEANKTFESVSQKLLNFHANSLNESADVSKKNSANKYNCFNRVGPDNFNMTLLEGNQNPESTIYNDNITINSLSSRNKSKSNKAIILSTNYKKEYVSNEMANAIDERRSTGNKMHTKENTNKVSIKTRCTEDRCIKNEREELMKYKMYRKLINRAVSIAKHSKLRKLSGTKVTVTKNISKGALLENCNQKITIDTLPKDVHDLKIQSKYSEFTRTKSVEKISVASSYNSGVTNLSDNSVIQTKETYVQKCEPAKALKSIFFNDLDRWKLLKKNFNWNTKPLMQSKGTSNFPFFEVDVREALNSISLQTNPDLFRKKNSQSNIKYKVGILSENASLSVASSQTYSTINSIDKEVYCTFGTHSLLQGPFNGLHKLPVMERSYATISASVQLPSLRSTKSSCDALKVCCIGVRRVSDHTVLLKWNVPRVMTGVQGYELLMDGRTVQSFGPMRSMAVVTCLPHTEKLVFTIRTLTATISQCGHYPSASIVYRPRVK